MLLLLFLIVSSGQGLVEQGYLQLWMDEVYLGSIPELRVWRQSGTSARGGASSKKAIEDDDDDFMPSK